MDCAKKTFLIIGDVPYGKHLQMLLVAALNISNVEMQGSTYILIPVSFR